MFGEELRQHIRERVASGQERIARVVGEQVRSREPALFDLLEESGEALLEPLLLAWTMRGGAKTAAGEILYGYMQKDRRPDTLTLRTDEEGVVYLPRVGYFATQRPDETALLQLDERHETGLLTIAGSTTPVPLERPAYVAEGAIEVSLQNHRLFRSFYAYPGGEAAGVSVSHVSRAKLEKVRSALEILKRCIPWYWSCIAAATRRIVVFENDRVNSFAVPAAHGAVFISTRAPDDEVFFVEDLAHQCGHVAFSAMTFPSASYLAVAPDTPLKAYTSAQTESRTVLQALHGVFTEATIAGCLDACHEDRVFAGRSAHELNARMAFILRRFGSDLHDLTQAGVLSEEGEWLVLGLAEVFRRIFDKRWPALRGLDMGNQPYVFSYERFVERNGVA